MPKKKTMKKKASIRVKKVDDFSVADDNQSKGMNLDEKNPKLHKYACKKARAR
jgi:hypothetical protein